MCVYSQKLVSLFLDWTGLDRAGLGWANSSASTCLGQTQSLVQFTTELILNSVCGDG